MTRPAPAPRRASPYQHMTALIVDDEIINRDLLKDVLEVECQCETAPNGRVALQMLDEKEFDLILLDIMMPGMDGFEVLERIREHYDAIQLPVIILSAITESKAMVKGFQLGANDYVTKPITPSVLVSRVRTHLQLKLVSDENQRHIRLLQSAEQMRTRLAQIASHDLKNPINNIQMAHHLLEEFADTDNPKIQTVLDTVKLNLQNMRSVMDVFLDMIAIHTDTMSLKQEPITVQDVLQSVVTQYEIAAQNKQTHLILHPAQGTVVGDGERLVQIVGNLVSNALKYSPKGSRVDVYADPRANMMRLCVRDNGQGVPPEERHLLFQEFSKLSPRPTAGEESTGLGLWIVRHLIERQGGQAGANFPEEGGSIFWVELPRWER